MCRSCHFKYRHYLIIFHWDPPTTVWLRAQKRFTRNLVIASNGLGPTCTASELIFFDFSRGDSRAIYEMSTPFSFGCCCAWRYVWNAFKMNTNRSSEQQQTANSEQLIRCVVNGSSTECMRTTAAASQVSTLTESNMRTPIPSCVSHITISLPSILFFYFRFVCFQSNSHHDTKCLFSMHCSWNIFEPILGFQFYVHVSQLRIHSERLSKYCCQPNDAGLAKENGCFFVYSSQMPSYFKHFLHHFSKFNIRILCAKLINSRNFDGICAIFGNTANNKFQLRKN